jgi:16S rRNA (cytosine967-C5)-methyltransferase
MWRADWGGCHPERERGVWAGSAARRAPAGSLAPARDDSIVMNERERALHLYRRIERESLFASLVLIGEPAAVRTIVLGILRWRSRLDFAIDHYAKSKIEPEIRDVLRVGAYQLMFMDVAKYAAVAETVSLAPKRARGFANAILRRISEHAPEPNDLATRTAHAQWLIDRWIRHYGAAKAEAIANANQQLSYPDVLSLTGEAPPDSEPSTLVEGIYKLRGSTADLDREKFWPMDEGSAAVAALAAKQGSNIIDLAAAPGGKTLLMRTRGANVVSNDVSLTRLLTLKHAKRVVSDARRTPFRRRFQVVLLDAPCSATGTIRKNPEIKWRLRESDLASFAKLQRELLASALELASETVVYSTCSLEPEENDEIVASSGAKIAGDPLRLTPDGGTDGFTAFVLKPPS